MLVPSLTIVVRPHPPHRRSSTMQSDDGSPSPSQQSEASLPLIAVPIVEGFSISREDALRLEEYVEEFQSGDTDVRTKIVAAAMAELCALRPASAPFNKAEASKVGPHLNNISYNAC